MPRDYAASCFVVMPIGNPKSEDAEHWRGIYQSLIVRGLKQAAPELVPIRSDEIAKPGSVTQEIVQYLHSSYLILADVSVDNSNVFLELGIRFALSNRTIMICDRGKRPTLPFDIADYRTIFYEDTAAGADAFVGALAKMIHAIRDDPNSADNPVQRVLAMSAMVTELERRGVSGALEIGLGQEIQRLMRARQEGKHVVMDEGMLRDMLGSDDELGRLIGEALVQEGLMSKVFSGKHVDAEQLAQTVLAAKPEIFLKLLRAARVK